MRTMLIVEDDAALGRLEADAFTAAGFAVVLARDEAGALEAARTRGVDFVIIDAHLGNTSGFDLADNLRRQPKSAGVPLLFVSGFYKAARHRADVIETFGAVDFLEKPVAPEELVRRVIAVLGPEPLPPMAPSAPTPAAITATSGLRGDLAADPFFKSISSLVRAKASGFLSVRREKVKKIVGLREGDVVFVKSNLLSECLGRTLVGAGVIREEDCAASLERMKSVSEPQGRALVGMGLLDEKGLEDALLRQLQLKLDDVFTWDSGEWQCSLRHPADVPVSGPVLSGIAAVYHGLCVGRGEAQLSVLLGDVNALAPKALPAAAKVADPDDAASQIVQGSDGTRTTQEIVDAHMLPRSHAFALFVALRELGLVVFAPPVAREAAPIPLERPVAPPIPLGPIVDPLDPDAERKLTKKLAEFEEATHYDVLGIPRSAGPGEVRRAFQALGREHHPDRHFAHASPHLRAVAERLYSRIVEAQRVLTDPEAHKLYNESTIERSADRFERILRADEASRAGRAAIDGGRYSDAVESFREAATLYPDEPLFRAWYAFAAWRANPDIVGAADRVLSEIQLAAAGRDSAELSRLAAAVRRASSNDGGRA